MEHMRGETTGSKKNVRYSGKKPAGNTFEKVF